MRIPKNRAARKASGRLGSSLPVSMALMVCGDTSRASANRGPGPVALGAQNGTCAGYAPNPVLRSSNALENGRFPRISKSLHFHVAQPSGARISVFREQTNRATLEAGRDRVFPPENPCPVVVHLKAEFVKSINDPGQLPTDGLPEVAFLGRSNVGKSSLINALTGQRRLAFTSSTPGRTQSLNFYRVD